MLLIVTINAPINIMPHYPPGQCQGRGEDMNYAKFNAPPMGHAVQSNANLLPT